MANFYGNSRALDQRHGLRMTSGNEAAGRVYIVSAAAVDTPILTKARYLHLPKHHAKYSADVCESGYVNEQYMGGPV